MISSTMPISLSSDSCSCSEELAPLGVLDRGVSEHVRDALGDRDRRTELVGDVREEVGLRGGALRDRRRGALRARRPAGRGAGRGRELPGERRGDGGRHRHRPPATAWTIVEDRAAGRRRSTRRPEAPAAMASAAALRDRRARCGRRRASAAPRLATRASSSTPRVPSMSSRQITTSGRRRAASSTTRVASVVTSTTRSGSTAASALQAVDGARCIAEQHGQGHGAVRYRPPTEAG